MNNDCRLVDGTGLTLAVGTRDQVMSFLKTQSPDGGYVVVGPGIDARFYRVEGMVYPSSGRIDGQAIPECSRDECLAVFRLAMELNKGTDDILSDEEFFKELEAMDGPDTRSSQRPDPAILKAALFDRLREAGVAKVSVEYDGACDSGCVEDVTAIGIGGDGEEMKLAEDLQGLVEEYVYERLPGGWEINDGSFGEVEIDVLAGTVIFDHNQRHTEITAERWEE